MLVHRRTVNTQVPAVTMGGSALMALVRFDRLGECLVVLPRRDALAGQFVKVDAVHHTKNSLHWFSKF